ncbi:ABC transporter permease [Nocardiopsis sp. NRRL B-16309]|uniref:ABC transporter permease n=1 Tax=Nocardiopsis sp. NRRL B-16309 TaxID=1519494 RepID=UPI0006ADFBC0|nr:ABC transporter permease [Nocardiopsis sp. NRRL B-16309]KOX15415.1 peptide ABC transporter permease [Nocardiopsis sp. NRRL B-16309]
MSAPSHAPESADPPASDVEDSGAKPASGHGDSDNRSLRQIAWQRLKRDKVAMVSGVVVALLILAAALAPLLVKWFGYPPTEYHQDLIDAGTRLPYKDPENPTDPVTGFPVTDPWGGISADHWLGVEPTTGRDLFSRLLYGAQISLLVAFLSTLLCVAIGTVMGIIAGYKGGWVDTVISRAMDIFLAFPLMLFAIALVGVIPDGMLGLTGNGLRVGVIVFIIGFFNWPYIARIVRGQTLSLREREFVEAARSLGASNRHILVKEILPNLVTPIIVYSTLLIPTNILFEAALSFLGVGINPPTPSWGKMLSEAIPFYQNGPYFIVFPGLAIFITVLAFNLFGDGLRDAFDPKTSD